MSATPSKPGRSMPSTSLPSRQGTSPNHLLTYTLVYPDNKYQSLTLSGKHFIAINHYRHQIKRRVLTSRQIHTQAVRHFLIGFHNTTQALPKPIFVKFFPGFCIPQATTIGGKLIPQHQLATKVSKFQLVIH